MVLSESQRVEQKEKMFREDINGHRFSNILFTRLVAKDRKFTKVDFKYSIFDACYLRGCIFDSCDFTGCRFVNSNLNGSSFTGCTFDYATFEKTQIDNDILQSGCPGLENLKMRFARSLRVNYQQLGDAISANRAIKIELDAAHAHLLKAWNSKESYYRKKYHGWQRIKAFFEWSTFKLLDFIWGNGESTWKLVRFSIMLLIAMAIVDVYNFRNAMNVGDYISALCDAPQIFLGVTKPSNYAAGYLSIITLTRLIIFGFFMSVIIKRFNRR